MSKYEERAERWSRPISEGSPCGDDCRYEDEFEQIEAEIGKLQSLDGSLPDWGQVEKLATAMLTSQTKDTTVLTALCVAMYHREGYAGLATGLMAFNTIARAHWDQLFPGVKRMKGRAGDYTWMIQQLTRLTGDPDNEPKPQDYEDMVVVQEQFTALDNFLREPFDSLHPAVGGFKQTLNYYIEQNRPVEAPPEPEAAEGDGDDVADWAEAGSDETPRDQHQDQEQGQWSAATTSVTDVGIPSRIDNDGQAAQVVEKATEALKLASEYYAKRAEQWEVEKKRIEDHLAHAGRVIQLHEEAATKLSGEGDEEGGDNDEDEEDDD